MNNYNDSTPSDLNLNKNYTSKKVTISKMTQKTRLNAKFF